MINFSYPAVIGILCFIGMLNFVHYFQNKSRAYLNFTGYLLCNAFYLLFQYQREESSFDLLTSVLGDWAALTNNAALLMSYGFAYHFYKEVLDLKNISRRVYDWLNKIGNIYLYLIVPFTSIIFLLNLTLIYQHMYAVILLLSFVLAMFWIYHFYKLKPPNGNLIIAGNILFCFGSILSFILIYKSNSDITQRHIFWYTYLPLKMGLLSEIFLFYAALVVR